MILYIFAILLLIINSIALAQTPISNQGWQNATVSSDAIAVDCAQLLLPFELGRLIVENNPTTERGEMDKSLRSSHAVKVSLQPETGTSDTISSITGCSINGARIQLATVDTGDTITVAHTVGVIEFAGGGNVVLDSPLKILTLQRKAGIWVSDGGVGGGSGGLAEDLSTSCTVGQGIASDGSGNMNCGGGIVLQSDCSAVVALGRICMDTDDGYLYTGDGTSAQRANRIRAADDCTPFAAIGDMCLDTTNGNLFAGDGEGANLIGGAGGGGSQTLDQTFDVGKTIDGANSEGNAFTVGNGTDGFKLFVGTGGPTIKCFVGSNTCDITADIPSGNSYRIKYNGTDGLAIDSSGNVTLSNNMLMYRSFWFGAGALSTDGTSCLNPEERQINAGPKIWTVKCSDSVNSILYGHAGMPDGYNGGTITFELHAVNENAAPSGNLVFEFSAMCRSDGEALNTNWGPAVSSTTSFTTQYANKHSATVTVSPHSTCAAGEDIFWRAVMNETSTTTQVANVYITGVKLEYPTSDWSDQ